MQTINSMFESVDAFVEWSGGTHAIKKILVANNGIGALKAIRSIRRWSYEIFGNERMIQIAVMATPEDLRANAEFIRLADEVRDVPGGSNNNNYANVNLICEIAEQLEVDGVMPMWGHASENPTLPRSLANCNRKISFIGPPAGPMHALGDKIGSTIIAQSAGVPTIAWNGDDIHIDYAKDGLSQETYDRANVTTVEDALRHSNRIGYPVMIKASEGGGGKGIRKVADEKSVANAFRQVQGEVPGSPIFIMRCVDCARHLEVQLLGDKYGQAVALNGRDCSVQRRHQKIIEEGPPTAASTDVFRNMQNAAIALAKAVGYENAGTLEYLFNERTQEFHFLELNPRLQVEHPVTENILGVNLPACQVQVAMGIPLHRIMDIRRLYNRNPLGRDTIDFEFSEMRPITKHCIAVRITAENPDAAFQPTSGNITEIHFRSAIDVWGYFSVKNNGSIHEFADSQFGHIFAHGVTREAARRAMVVALKELQIRGDIRTTVEYIIRMLQADDFVADRIDNTWLDKRIARHKQLKIEECHFSPTSNLIALCGAAVRGFQHFEKAESSFISLLKVGQVPARDTIVRSEKIDLIYENVKYAMVCTRSGQNSVIITCNNTSHAVNIRRLSDGGYLLDVKGKNRLVYTQEEGGGSFRIVLDGSTCVFTPEYDPTRLTSSVSGKLARLLVSEGDHVNAGDAYCEVEVMKMYMPLKAEAAGLVHFQLSEGALLQPGDLIATLLLDDQNAIVKAQEYLGDFHIPAADVRSTDITLPHLALRESQKQLEKVLNGYLLSESDIDAALVEFVRYTQDKTLAPYEMEEAMAVLRGRIDAGLFEKISHYNSNYRLLLAEDSAGVYPSHEILTTLWEFAQKLDTDKKSAFLKQITSVWEIAEANLFSTQVRLLASLLKFVETYLNVEKLFDSMSFTDVINEQRKVHQDDLQTVWNLACSHVNLEAKNILVLKVLDVMVGIPMATINKRPRFPNGVPIRSEIHVRHLKNRLTDLSKLKLAIYSRISFAASLMLMEHNTLSQEQRRARLHDALVQCLSSGDPVGMGERVVHMKKFVESNIAVLDLLYESMRQDRDYQIAFMELYLRKMYQKTHHLKNFQYGYSLADDGLDANTWIKFDFMTRSMESASCGADKNLSYDDLAALGVKYHSNASLPGTELESAGGSPRNNNATDESQIRIGAFACFETAQDFMRLLPNLIEKIPLQNNASEANSLNAVHVIIMRSDGITTDSAPKYFSKYLCEQYDTLIARSIRRVTVVIAQADETAGRKTAIPPIFTFRSRNKFQEDVLFRHIEAPLAFHLDLPRLANYEISLEDGLQTSTGNVHLYKAVPKGTTGPVSYFARLVSFTTDVSSSDAEALFVEALDTLALAKGRDEAITMAKKRNQPPPKSQAANHIFLNIVAPDSVIHPDFYEGELRRICTKYSLKMAKLAVANVELKLTCRLHVGSEPMFIRLNASNPTGFVLKIDQYYEAKENNELVFRSVKGKKGDWDGLSTSTPYNISRKFEAQRAEALASSDTLYVYDWPLLFERAVEDQWTAYYAQRPRMKKAVPAVPFKCQELVLHDASTMTPLAKGWTAQDAEKAVLVPTDREPGNNDTGMVAWLMTMYTPEFPRDGRQVVVISNDITFKAGSFGTTEDMLFYKASEYARTRGLCRLFLAANSGARIGMAQSLMDKFSVCWVDPEDPSKGFKYIYLTDAIYNKLLESVHGDANALPVVCERVQAEDGTRYMITDIIGSEPDLGVENLMGSGLIAGETSRAYDDIFTLTLVVGRTVGIGAYLVRLGQRTIQKTRQCPIILTGYQALNKLMGREIYTTNDQLGGPMIMYPNGVSHLLADTHMDVISKALQWLSFVPASKNSVLPIHDISGVDTVDRKVEFTPKKGIVYDPRYILAGVTHPAVPGVSAEFWESGFCDKDSFVEFLSGWAKTVVVGRARLGGIPIGVIATENRTSEAFKPADPADMTSQEQLVQQAGGVWFPDSAYKTAQALRDFNRESLPCFIFANWRGFSGGQRDMFDEVLKFGSMIVDALVAYQHPIFVYIPPFAELRGGAWVVVDSTINTDVMEFYAAEDARGGVLEAAGAASIKYRDNDIRKSAHRVDHVLVQLDRLLASENDAERRKDIERQILQREKIVFGVFRQIAIHFADLHDTPGRMQHKGVIRQQVQWEESRKYFYWRLRRRLAELNIVKTIMEEEKSITSKKAAVGILKEWFIKSGNTEEQWEDDLNMLRWQQDNPHVIRQGLIEIHTAAKAKQLGNLLVDVICVPVESGETAENNQHHVAEVFKRALGSVSAEDRSLIIESLKSALM